MSDGAKALCEARTVSHDFKLPNGKPIRVLQDVDLTVQPDEVVALLGPSGCGKSTILRILAGLIRPTQGEVFYHGEPLHGLNPGAAIVFQSFALYPWMTVRENVEAVLRAAGMKAAAVAAASRRPTRASCPAARSSASAWPGPWRWTPRSSSWTSRSARSTP